MIGEFGPAGSGRESGPASAGSRSFDMLHGAWLRRLREDWEGFNYLYAGKRLRPPLFRIGDARVRLGEWDRESRTITISESHILAHSWFSVLSTLRHEMAHQYVDEVMRRWREGPHGEAFAAACRVLRVEPGACAEPGSLEPIEGSAAREDVIVSRVKKLLALAGSPNEHEAASAMRTANRLMLEYNVDLVKLDTARGYETRVVGTVSPRRGGHEHALALILQEHFFVQTIWVPGYDARRDVSGRVLQLVGTPANLKIAEYVYHYVDNLLEPSWREHLRANPEGRGTRAQYLAGLLAGLRAKLDEQRDGLRRESALVWSGDPGLAEYFRHVHPRVRHGSGRGVQLTERYAAGLGDGREIQIRGGIEAGPASARGRRLGPGRSS